MTMTTFSLSANTYKWVMDNGLVVIVKTMPSELVSAQVAVRTGSKDEGGDLGKGLSHFLEHLLFKGTERRTGDQIDLEIEAAGGRHNAYTSWEHTVYHVTGVTSGLERYLDVLSDMVFHSTLSPELMGAERDVVLEEMKGYNDEAWDVLSRNVLWATLRESALRFPIIGFEKDFKALTRQALWNYYKKRYVPNNIVLLITGGVTVEEVKALADRYFGYEKRGEEVVPTNTFEMPYWQARTLRLEGPQTQAHGVVEYAVPYLNADCNEALKALALALGAGETSLLWKKLREEQELVHDIGASYDRLGVRGVLSLSYLCDPDKVAFVETAIFQVIEEVRQKGIPAELLERVKRQAKVGMLNALKTVQGQAGRLLNNYLVHGDLRYTECYYERLTNLTLEDVHAAALTFLQPWNVFCATMQPGESRIPLDVAPEVLPIEYGVEATEAQKQQMALLFSARRDAGVSTCDVKASVPAGEGHNNDKENKGLQTVKYLPFETISGAHGVPVYLQGEDALPLVHLSLFLRGGVLVESTAMRGATTLLGTMLRRARPEVIARMEALGGRLDDQQGGHALSFHLSVLKEDFADAVTCLSEVIKWPEGKELSGVFDREKQGLLDEVTQLLDGIEVNAFWEVRRLGFGDYPYRDPSRGRLETIKNIQLQDLQTLWQRLFVSGNAKIVIAGQFDKEGVQAALKPLLAALPEGQLEIEEPVFVAPESVLSRTTLPGRQQAFICQAYPVPGESAKGQDPYTQSILREIMGTMGSSLFKSLRDQGLVYSAGATILGGWGKSLWTFYAGTNPTADNEKQVMAAFDVEIARLQRGDVSLEELDRAKQGLFVAHESMKQDMGARAGMAGWFTLMGHGVNDWMHYMDRVRAVTREDVQAFAVNYFKPECCVRVVVEPEPKK